MVRELGSWLNELGLGKCFETFVANDVDFELLTELDDGDLEQLGISFGHRKRLLRAIAELKAVPREESPRPGPARVTSSGGERRQLTVMFIDLVGSTALSGRLDPEEMGGLLRAFQGAVTGEIARFEGHAAKFMGDGVLAYFGWPRAHEDEAERSVRAGLAISEAVAALSGGGAPLACRIGIATGLVVVGDLIGTGTAQEETVVGETPNLAARLQAEARPGQVVIAETTRRLVGQFFDLVDLGQLDLKGIAQPAQAFAVLGERALESRFAAHAGSSIQPIVGRDQELALLLERWRQAEAGEGQMVLLTGEAGIGKSRIAEALFAALEERPHINLRYQCSPYHADSALWPVRQQLLFAAGIGAEDTTDIRLDKIEALLIPTAGGLHQSAALFANLLGIDTAARYGKVELSPEQRRERTLAALVDQLIALAAQQPVLFVLEDAHWVDPTSLEMVELTLDRIPSSRVLMVITARPTFSHGFGGHPIVTRLALNRLGRTQTAAIIERIAGRRTLSEHLVEEIATRTDGVPLFVEEMTKAVLETSSEGETAGTRLAIPTSLHDSLMARLDRLKSVKEVAQTAAVIGRGFDHRTIAALASLPETDVAAALDRLVEAELVFRRGSGPAATYLFKHALVRDAAYESLLKTRRQALHGRLFEILERRGDAPPEILAQHAEAAGLAAKAIDCWERAGQEAIARPAYKEAIAHLEAAIRLCRQLTKDPEGPRRECQLQIRLGQALLEHLGYQAPGTMVAFERARELAEQIGEPSLLVPSMYGLWANRYVSGIPAPELAARFSELTESDGDSGSRCVALRMLGLERFHEGKYQTSLRLIEEGLSFYNPIAHRDLGMRYGHDPRTGAMNYKAWALWHLGFQDQARETMEQSLSWAREIGHHNTIGIALSLGVAITGIWCRDVSRVEAGAAETLRLAKDKSLALWQALGRIHFGWALSELGHPDGLAEIEAGLDDLRRIKVGRYECFHLGLAADARSRAGQHDAAQATIAAAFAAQAKGRDMAFLPDLHRLRAMIALRASGDAVETAETDFNRALALARDQASPSLELRAARDLARLWGELGERRRARDLLAPIYRWFTEGLANPDLQESKRLLDHL
jgi:class 3 adenylate cyclase/tetratricopeptide (TPR) repeat protein/energy-coupling factor transporter ATP-binding protein EcfA2